MKTCGASSSARCFWRDIFGRTLNFAEAARSRRPWPPSAQAAWARVLIQGAVARVATVAFPLVFVFRDFFEVFMAVRARVYVVVVVRAMMYVLLRACSDVLQVACRPPSAHRLRNRVSTTAQRPFVTPEKSRKTASRELPNALMRWLDKGPPMVLEMMNEKLIQEDRSGEWGVLATVQRCLT